jgi:hypothetical protein
VFPIVNITKLVTLICHICLSLVFTKLHKKQSLLPKFRVKIAPNSNMSSFLLLFIFLFPNMNSFSFRCYFCVKSNLQHPQGQHRVTIKMFVSFHNISRCYYSVQVEVGQGNRGWCLRHSVAGFFRNTIIDSGVICVNKTDYLWLDMSGLCHDLKICPKNDSFAPL